METNAAGRTPEATSPADFGRRAVAQAFLSGGVLQGLDGVSRQGRLESFLKQDFS